MIISAPPVRLQAADLHAFWGSTAAIWATRLQVPIDIWKQGRFRRTKSRVTTLAPTSWPLNAGVNVALRLLEIDEDYILCPLNCSHFPRGGYSALTMKWRREHIGLFRIELSVLFFSHGYPYEIVGIYRWRHRQLNKDIRTSIDYLTRISVGKRGYARGLWYHFDKKRKAFFFWFWIK